jgi:hypothetical protein
MCVKECPENQTAKLECHPTSWMTGAGKDKYAGCTYFPAGVNSGIYFQYATKQIGGFCLPDLTSLY